MGKKTGSEVCVGSEVERAEKHLVLNEEISCLFRATDRLSDFIDRIGGLDRPIEEECQPQQPPSLLAVLDDAQGQIASNIMRIDDAISRLRGMLF